KDSGAGIQEANLPQLFEPFFTTRSSGMGMGLAISSSIVEAHRGQIWASNNPEGGDVLVQPPASHEGGGAAKVTHGHRRARGSVHIYIRTMSLNAVVK
uniref:ATP-binding protein n=1 Tax=Paraburkholderia caledonica TaxID=134536 RepID=UPI00277D11EC